MDQLMDPSESEEQLEKRMAWVLPLEAHAAFHEEPLY